MQRLVIDSTNVSSAVNELKNGGKYFVITVDVWFPKGITVIGANSVLAFRGGSFATTTTSIIYFNTCVIDAGPYPIFHKNVQLFDLECAEVKAEWFRSSDDTSDDEFINRAISMANGCPVVLEAKTYTIRNSIQFNASDSSRQTLICPGTLSLSDKADNIPVIDINAQTVTLKINKIVGRTVENTTGIGLGIGLKFSIYNEHSDIEVGAMRSLHMGFCACPDVRSAQAAGKLGGIQYCRIKFGTIQADYCFYIDVYSGARVMENNPKEISNWFNENQITGELMEGRYGIYTVGPEEAKADNPALDPGILINAMNGLRFENISFERITGLALRLRSVMRSTFLNMQMFNSMPGGEPNSADDFTPWIDMNNIRDVRMTFNSYVVPTRIQAGDNCKNTYINGAILDDPANYGSHFDTLGIDTLYGKDASNQLVQKSQMFVTSSVTPFNMTKEVGTGTAKVTTAYLSDLLPNLKDGTTNTSQISLPVLPNSLHANVDNDKTLVLDLSSLKDFAPCLYTVYASIAPEINDIPGGKLQFQASGNLKIEGGMFDITGICKKIVTASGWYMIQWLDNWTLRISLM